MSMRVRSAFAALPVALSFLVLLATPSRLAGQAQASTGVIRGTVKDTTGAPIAGATVTVLNRETNASRSMTTNSSGAYAASLLRVGTYQVSVRQLGFRPQSRDGIRVGLGEAAEVNFQLVPEVVRLEEITVAAEEPFIDPARVAASTKFDAQVVEDIPNNGRNFMSLTLLTPHVAIVQGPDGDEISIAGQKGIHNNVSVDGADFNNPFFGEQRGGQRPAFTFNLDAVEEMVVVSQGANAEFGRSSGGFVNVVTKSGTNEFHGSAHYFGKFDALSADYSHEFSGGGTSSFEPDFSQNQFGMTFGGPIIKDKAFFFIAYDQQVYDDTKQKTRQAELSAADPNFAVLSAYVDTAFGGALNGEFGSISRTNDAKALLAKVDFRFNPRNNLSIKYNYTDSEQKNGTFDVDLWGRSANGLEQDHSHAVNGLLSSVLSNSTTNEFRFQYAREDRPRPYEGALNPATDRPFPDTDISFTGYRIGMPFFLPLHTAYDWRVQLLDNISWTKGTHLFKAGVEWNRTEVNQTFVGFANGRMSFSSVDGFINYSQNGNGYVECSDGSSSLVGTCPPGETITGPVVLYLQQAGVGGISVEEAGTQQIVQNEYALFLQDSWKARPNLTVDYGLRWEALINPDPITPADEVFYAPLVGTTVTNSTGTYDFPSDGTLPSDKSMWQPRLGISWDVNGDAKSIVRGSAGIYYARLASLNMASVRSTNGSRGQTLAGGSAFGTLPDYGELLPDPDPSALPDHPNIFVMDKDWQAPRTISATFSYERELSPGFAASLAYTHASTDNITRFVNRNDAVFGSPWSTGIDGTNGVGSMTTLESEAKSRYNGFTVGLRRATSRDFQFQINYTLSYDKSDDDNERDPFKFYYAQADSLDKEYNWSDRDQRHRFNAWVMTRVPGDIYINNRISAYSAQPTSESCGRPGSPPAGERAIVPQDRICADGSILQRNTIRKDNAFFSWDIRFSKPFAMGTNSMEVIFEIFNLFNTDNFRDPASGGLFLNFDGTIRSGLGEPRQAQAGLRYVF